MQSYNIYSILVLGIRLVCYHLYLFCVQENEGIGARSKEERVAENASGCVCFESLQFRKLLRERLDQLVCSTPFPFQFLVALIAALIASGKGGTTCEQLSLRTWTTIDDLNDSDCKSYVQLDVTQWIGKSQDDEESVHMLLRSLNLSMDWNNETKQLVLAVLTAGERLKLQMVS